MKDVKLYSTPSCVFCKMAREFFQANDIAYQEYDVATDLKAREEMISRSGQFGVPVIDVGGELVIGFDRPRLAELLGVK